MTAPLPDVLVTVSEAARLLKLSRNTVYQLIYAGDIPTISIGRARRIRYAALHEWAERSERGASPVPWTAQHRRRA